MSKSLAIISVSMMLMLNSGLPISHAEEWVSYTVGHGLIDNAINTITVDDHRKAVWFGTVAGANVFDGYQWTSYLEGIDVRAIAVDPEGKVWFGTSEGVKVLDGDEWREDISHRFMQDVAIDQQGAQVIQDIVIDRQGVKWFATRAGIKSTIDGLTWESYKKAEKQLVNDIIASILPYSPEMKSYRINISDLSWLRNNITSIAVDGHNDKWLATNAIFNYTPDPNVEFALTGLGVFDGKNWRLIKESCKFELSPEATITSVVVDAEDSIWYGKLGSGAFKFDRKKITRYFSQDIDGNGKWEGRQSLVTASDLDGDGNKEIVTIAYSDYDLQPRGLYIYDNSGRERWQYRIGPNLQDTELIAIGDVNGDGISEIVMGSGVAYTMPGPDGIANDTDDCHGYIFIMDWVNQKNLWGIGKSEALTEYGGGVKRVAIADLDEDGSNDIVGFITWKAAYTEPGDEPKKGIIVTDAYGNEKMSYILSQPRAVDHGAVSDLDNDGDLEIIAVEQDPRGENSDVLTILDHNLSPLFQVSVDEFQLNKYVSLVAVTDLYGDSIPEILLKNSGQLLVFSYKAGENTIGELWKFPKDGENIGTIKRVILSDLYPGGSTEIIVSADKLYILSADVETNAPLSSVDTGWRYGRIYDLKRTLFYPHAPTIPIPAKPFVIKKSIELPNTSWYILTGDVTGDGLPDIVQTYEDEVSVISREGGVESPWEVLWTNSYPSEYRNIAVTALDDVIGDGKLEILADVLLGGRPQLLFIDGISGAIIKSIPCEAGVTDELKDNYAFTIEVDHDGSIWFGTRNGVSRFDGDDGWISYTVADGLIDNSVQAIAFDESNNVWFGTRSGVTRYDRTWITLPPSDVKADTIILQVDTQNSVWAGTRGDGVYRYDNGKKTHYMSFHYGHDVYSMLVDSENRTLWVSTWMGGLDRGVYKIDIDSPLDEPLEPTFTYENTGGQLVSNRVTAMTKDSLGRLWFGTAPHSTHPDAGCGISMYDVNQDKWEKFPFQKDSPVIPEHITAIKAARDGVLWFGSLFDGVRSYDGTTWIIYTVEDGLADNQINDIEEDATGALWFATPKGVSRYHPSAEKWKTFTTADGLADNTVCDIDIAGNDVWFATNGGVSRFDGKHWIAYDQNDGIPTNFVLSLVVDREGKLWIGTKGGLVSQRLPESDCPGTFITSKPAKRVGVANAVFEYLGCDLGTDASDLLYQYQLTAHNPDIKNQLSTDPLKAKWLSWSGYTSQTKVAYEGLPDGEYTFRVRAIDSDENIDPEPDAWTFTVDTGQPIAAIIEPKGGQVVRGIVSIKGIASDTDFKDYQVRWAKGKPDALDEWKQWPKRDIPVSPQREKEELESWNTAGLKGFYTIELIVTDQLDHLSRTVVTAEVDNTPPIAKLISPTNNQSLSGVIKITGEISDEHIAGYTAQLLQSGQQKLIETKNVSKSGQITISNFDSSAIYGKARIRLTAFDLAGNESAPAEVEVFFNEVEVSFFTFGIEVKTKNSETWEFIQDIGMKLQATDLLRVPPDAILRLKTEGDSTIKILPGQEDFVEKLIEKAKQQGSKPQNRRDIKNTILETQGNAVEPEVESATSEKGLRSFDIDSLRPLAVIGDNSLVKKVIGGTNPPTREYPYRNLGYARYIFDKLIKMIKPKEKKMGQKNPQPPEVTWDTQKGDEIDMAILYLALLRELNIDADFKQCEDGALLILFDSGFTRKSINRITTNPTLYQIANEKAWLSILFIPSNDNFLNSWYKGGRAVFELSK